VRPASSTAGLVGDLIDVREAKVVVARLGLESCQRPRLPTPDHRRRQDHRRDYAARSAGELVLKPLADFLVQGVVVGGDLEILMNGVQMFPLILGEVELGSLEVTARPASQLLPAPPAPLVVLPPGDHVVEEVRCSVLPTAEFVPGADQTSQIVGPQGILVDCDVELPVQSPKEFILVGQEADDDMPLGHVLGPNDAAPSVSVHQPGNRIVPSPSSSGMPN